MSKTGIENQLSLFRRAIDRRRRQVSGLFHPADARRFEREADRAGFRASGTEVWLCTLYLQRPWRVRFYLDRPLDRLPLALSGVLMHADSAESVDANGLRVLETSKEKTLATLDDILRRFAPTDLRGAVLCQRRVLESPHGRVTVEQRRRYAAVAVEEDALRLETVHVCDLEKVEYKYPGAGDARLLDRFASFSLDSRTNFELLSYWRKNEKRGIPHLALV